DAIAERWVDTTLELAPEHRVALGRPGREGEYGDYSPEGIAASIDAARAALASLRAATPVDFVDEITQRDLRRELELTIEIAESGAPLRDLNIIASPVQGIREVFDLEPSRTPEHWAVIAQRLRHVRGAIEGYIITLRKG